MLLVGSNVPQIDTVGTEVQLTDSASTHQISVYYTMPFIVKLTSNLVVFGSCNGYNRDSGVIFACGISGTTISIESATSTSLYGAVTGWETSGNSAVQSAIRHSDSSLIIAKNGAVDGTNTRQLARLTYNAGTQFSVNASSYVQTADKIRTSAIRELDSTYAIMAWTSENSIGTQNYLRFAVITKGSVAVGTTAEVNQGTSITSIRDLITLDSTHAIVIYSGNSHYARLLTISGTAVTVGSELNIIESPSEGIAQKLDKINSNLAYLYTGRGNYPTDNHDYKTQFTLSGGVLTAGTSEVLFNNTTYSHNTPVSAPAVAENGDSSMLFYSDQDDSLNPYFAARVGLSNYNVTKLFTESPTKIISAIMLTPKKAFIIYSKKYSSYDPIYGRVITLK